MTSRDTSHGETETLERPASNVIQLPAKPSVPAIVRPPIDPTDTVRAENDLFNMLRTKRPAFGRTEKKFLRRWLYPLGGWSDAFGNFYVQVGDGQSDVIWSSHTDSVHTTSGEQRLLLKNYKNLGRTLELSAKEKQSNCLGADCATGVWIMREMILNKVPGLYIFHRDEESGGRGSSWIAKNKPELLKLYKFAIAFDRRGTDSVITHQFSQRCCSKAFVDSICKLLPEGYKADDGGTFTDTANYTDHIGECSNLSVGYSMQHTKSEYQSVDFAMKLRAAMLAFDESALVSERKPGDYESKWGGNYGKGYKPHGGTYYHGASTNHTGHYSDSDLWEDDPHIQGVQRPKRAANWNSGLRSFRAKGPIDDTAAGKLLDFITMYPDEVADYLATHGIGVDDLLNANPHIPRESDFEYLG